MRKRRFIYSKLTADYPSNFYKTSVDYLLDLTKNKTPCDKI